MTGHQQRDVRVLMMHQMFVKKHDMLHSVITYGLNPELLFGDTKHMTPYQTVSWPPAERPSAAPL